MATWQEIERAFPEFAAKVKARFHAGTNKTIAHPRGAGAPRISATELKIEDGDISLGMMNGSMKLRDVRRDPRIAVHSPTIEPPADNPESWPGDAKLSGQAVAVPEPPDAPVPGAGYFRIDVNEVSLTYVGVPAD